MSDKELTAEQAAANLVFKLRVRTKVPLDGDNHNAAITAIAAALDSYAAERVAEERRKCVEAAKNARLPDGYQWGEDAMEQFNFGKERAAEEIGKRGQK